MGALAAQADATAANPNDTPALLDLGEVADHSAVAVARGAAARTEAASQIDHEAETAAAQEQVADETQAPRAAPDEPATAEARPPVEYWLDDHWRELNSQLHEAQQTSSDDEVQAAFEERQAYENEVLDPAGHNRGRQESWEQYAGRMLVTDEHRRRYDELSQHRIQAVRDRDPAAREAAVAAQDAYRAEIGPDRAYRLHREVMDRFSRQSERRRLERETRQRWMERPHSRLTPDQLVRAINDAEATRAANLAATEKLRATIAATEPAVAAGHGPQAERVDAHLAQLRRNADLTAAAHDTVEKLQAAQRTATMAAAQASGKRVEAELTPWYRPGLRHRLLEEAAHLDTRAQQADREVKSHQRQLGELKEAGLKPPRSGYGDDLKRARQDLQQAEDSYERDRDQAHQVDLAALGGQRDLIARHDTAAGDAVKLQSALIAEQYHRAEMPADQAAAESNLRLNWITEQMRIAEKRQRQQRQERDSDHDYGYGYEHGIAPVIDRGIDHGSGMGL